MSVLLVFQAKREMDRIYHSAFRKNLGMKMTLLSIESVRAKCTKCKMKKVNLILFLINYKRSKPKNVHFLRTQGGTKYAEQGKGELKLNTYMTGSPMDFW